MPIRAVIVDDEPPARAGLGDCSPITRTSTSSPNAVTARRRSMRLKPRRPIWCSSTSRCRSSTASTFCRRSTCRGCPEIIFVSAFDHYAVRAFKVHALDYVLKPVEPDRLGEALAHARLSCADRHSADRRASRPAARSRQGSSVCDAGAGALGGPRARDRSRRRGLAGAGRQLCRAALRRAVSTWCATPLQHSGSGSIQPFRSRSPLDDRPYRSHRRAVTRSTW